MSEYAKQWANDQRLANRVPRRGVTRRSELLNNRVDCLLLIQKRVSAMLSQVLTRKEQFVIVFLGASICLGSFVLYSVSPRSEAEPTVQFVQAPVQPVENVVDVAPFERVVEQHSPAVTSLQVSVAGAVRDPGLYTFDAESRVQDAVDAAGGTLEWADLSDINLAARLIDGTTLAIPGEPTESRNGQPIIRRPMTPPPNPPQYTVSGWQSESAPRSGGPLAAMSNPSTGLVDINRATTAELETLPGIGPKYAAEIIRFREHQPFQSVEDLELVSGIGPKRLESIRSLVTVGR